jgi:CO dehydrogenase nickel-insertion accessory protein CooC1
MEHLSRRTARDVQVCWWSAIPPSAASSPPSGSRVSAALDIHIEHAYLIVNRLEGHDPRPLQERINALDIPLLGTVPGDEELAAFEFSGRPLVELGDESPVYQAVGAMLRRIDVVR